jgi:hypothetical protein
MAKHPTTATNVTQKLARLSENPGGDDGLNDGSDMEM